MRYFIDQLKERNFQKRTVAFIENGSWAPVAKKIMKADFEDMKHMTIAKNNVTILSALNEESTAQIDALADELSKGYLPVSAKTQAELDPTALSRSDMVFMSLRVMTEKGQWSHSQHGNTGE